MNAKKEFLEHISIIDSRVKCASITGRERYNQFTDRFDSDSIFLKVNYSESDYQVFLKQLDFVYDDGFGGQELYGTIWFENGTWSSRGEYDGSEWWEYNSCPEIVEECK